MHNHDDEASAKIHVLRTASQTWALFKIGPKIFEIWAAEQPDRPTNSAALFLARFTVEAEAERVTKVLNQMWDALLTCLDLAESSKTSDGYEMMVARYEKMQSRLDGALQVAKQEAHRVLAVESSQIRQLFNLVHHTVRSCSGSVVRYQRESTTRAQFTGMLRVQREVRETSRQIKALYARQA